MTTYFRQDSESIQYKFDSRTGRLEGVKDLRIRHESLRKMVIEDVAKHLPADGSVYITNNLKYHNAFNGGEENRVHLVACLTDYKFQ